MSPIMMLVFCQKRQREILVDEFDDWREEGVTVKLHGVTHKAHDGFILLEWSQPVPERFHDKLKKDTDVIDYLTYHPAQLVPVTA